MSSTDVLVLECREPDCGARFDATRAKAIGRWGPGATSYIVEQMSQCPCCRAKNISVAIASAPNGLRVETGERINSVDVSRMKGRVGGTCAPCNMGVEIAVEGADRYRPLKILFEREQLRCHKCRVPLAGISVEGYPNPGGNRQTLFELFVPGSPADPLVRSYWAGVRKALGR